MKTRIVTDYSRFSHEELGRMLHAGNADRIRAVGDAWDDAGRNLHDRSNQIADQLSEFSPLWDGGAAEQYMRMMKELKEGISICADTAYEVRNQVYRAGEDLRQAQQKMPAAVTVTPVDPSIEALASGSLPTSTAAALWEAAGPAGRPVLVEKVQKLQQETAVATAAANTAQLVMTEVAQKYMHTEESIPATPAADEAPRIARMGTGAEATVAVEVENANGNAELVPLTGAARAELLHPQPTRSEPKLFGNMYTAGLMAVGGAVGMNFDRIGNAMRGLIGIKPTGKHTANATQKKDGMGTSPEPARGMGGGELGSGGLGGGELGSGGLGSGGLGGAGLGSGGLGGGGLGSGTPHPAAIGSPVLAPTGAGSAAGAASMIAATGAASAGKAAMGGMPIMPMMPMGGMADGAAGSSGKRLPPWLVEDRVEVWDVAMHATPGVLGADPTPESKRPGRA